MSKVKLAIVVVKQGGSTFKTEGNKWTYQRGEGGRA
jgi:hypothetical protein